ncbi:LysE family transporter [Sediminibacterium roseum]|uniref:LysE family transporter n=1 Tax=Sediminibacterium roseum TaxID=1978412 RepID=A0ABW9ZV86_9BACT|nr:LysE family transporter [Sediminibacterium roseum]NCI51071.1 LysE family transporter [Sediminibacterium roseum]
MIYILLLGLLVSFLGQLPLGNMSFTSTQICIQEGAKKAWQFAFGVAIVEMVYLRVALTGMDWIVKHRTWFLVLGWITVAMFLVLGVLAFHSANKQKGEKKALLLNNKLNRFVLGLLMSALNPVQIPFWFLWTSTFIQTHALPVEMKAFDFFTVGAGGGTLAGLAVYIHGGNFLVSKMNTSNKTLNKIMGVIFIITALIQLWRMIYQPFI